VDSYLKNIRGGKASEGVKIIEGCSKVIVEDTQLI
jgi:hypothetical protein